jgi:hypothetical protein
MLWKYTMVLVVYLNIGVKIVYWFLFEDIFCGPLLMSHMGLDGGTCPPAPQPAP